MRGVIGRRGKCGEIGTMRSLSIEVLLVKEKLNGMDERENTSS